MRREYFKTSCLVQYYLVLFESFYSEPHSTIHAFETKHSSDFNMFSTTYDKDNKVWSGKDIVPTYNPKISIAQVILSTLHMHGPGIAQVLKNIELQNQKILIQVTFNSTQKYSRCR